jgi:hypothetical protein
LHAAAVAATDDVLLDPTPQLALVWLSNYGQYLTRLRLKIRQCSQPLQQLACKDLLDLKLIGRFDITPGTTIASGFFDVFRKCTKLTRLELDYSTFDPERALADSLCRLEHLQHLDVVTRDPGTRLPAAALPVFKHLTYLRFVTLSVDSLVEPCAALSGVTDLQELHFAAKPLLPHTEIGLSSAPGLSFPASLKMLVLLSPVEAELLSLVPSGLQDLRVDCEVVGPGEGPGSFLSYVGQMRHFTRLSLQEENLVYWPPPGRAYSALTANSNLVELEMFDTYCPQVEGLWPHMFPASHKLPHIFGVVGFRGRW